MEIPKITYKEALENILRGEAKENFPLYVHELLVDLMEKRIHLEGCGGEIVRVHNCIVSQETAQLKDFESKYRKKRKEWRAERGRLEASEEALKRQLDDIKAQKENAGEMSEGRLRELEKQEKLLEKKMREFSRLVGLQTLATIDRARNLQVQQLDQSVKHINKITVDAGVVEDLSIADFRERALERELRAKYFHRIEVFLDKYRVLVETQCIDLERFANVQAPRLVAEYQEQYAVDREREAYQKLEEITQAEDPLSRKILRMKAFMEKYNAYDYEMPPYFTRDFFINLGGEISDKRAAKVRDYLNIYLPIFETIDVVLSYMKNSSDSGVREGYYALFIRYFKPGLHSLKDQRLAYAHFSGYRGKSEEALNRLFYRKVKGGLETFARLFWFMLNPENAEEDHLRDIFDKMVEIVESDNVLNLETYFEKARELVQEKFLKNC
ncbi:MAG: hypothetical protein Q4C55_09025 [Eubacterium sp.]|nr:hypothetical protein [Eubacterium sp.]